jgi:hypothetical protein
MEPIGWATQIEAIWHGAPHSGLRPDARSRRNEYSIRAHIYAPTGILTHGSFDLMGDYRSAVPGILVGNQDCNFNGVTPETEETPDD